MSVAGRLFGEGVRGFQQISHTNLPCVILDEMTMMSQVSSQSGHKSLSAFVNIIRTI